MPLIGVSLLLQILLVTHAVKTGRDQRWIYFIVFVPVVGPTVYVIAELLPSLGANRALRQTLHRVHKTLDPSADLRRYGRDLEITNNVENRLKLGQEALDNGLYKEAAAIFQDARRGIYQFEPVVLMGLAQAHFGLAEYQACRQTLDHLIRHNPDFKSAEGHLLYARTLENLGDITAACDEYSALSQYYTGAEAKYRYANLLNRTGQQAEATKLLMEILDTARLAPKHYRRAQKVWLDKSREALKGA